MEVTRWLVHHGESLLESIGIIGGLIFTGVALRRDSRARRVENLLTITQHQREIWSAAQNNPKLTQAFAVDRDARQQPPTPEERLFVRSLILHLGTVYRAIKLDELLKPQGMDADIRAFFSKPVVCRVWEEEMRFQDADFALFVNRTLRDEPV